MKASKAHFNSYKSKQTQNAERIGCVVPCLNLSKKLQNNFEGGLKKQKGEMIVQKSLPKKKHSGIKIRRHG